MRHSPNLSPSSPVRVASDLTGLGLSLLPRAVTAAVILLVLPAATAQATRNLGLSHQVVPRGDTVNVPVVLDSEGNENALGCSITFDPALLAFSQATVGSGAIGASLNVNSLQAASGRIGIVLALGFNQSFAAGIHEVVVLSFTTAAGPTTVLTPLTFSDQPVQRILADALANPLPAAFRDAWIALEVGGSCATCDPIYIAGGGHGAGFAGSLWKMDLEVHNRGAELGIYTVALLKRGYDNPAPVTHTYTIEPGTSTRFVDAVFTEFGWGGWATLLVRPIWGEIMAAGRLYNEQQTGPCTGCLFGGLLRPLRDSAAFGPGDEARLIQLSHSMDHYTGFRCHLGLVSATAQVIDITADFYDSGGGHLGTLDYHLGPLRSLLETDVFEKLSPPVNVVDGYIVLTSPSPGARFFAYAMQRESAIGDPIMIVAE